MRLFLPLLLLAFTANAYEYKEYEQPMEITKSSERIAINFMTPDKINQLWSDNVEGDRSKMKVHAFTLKSDSGCQIFIPKTTNSWNDNHMLREIGHEVLHCLGASHE